MFQIFKQINISKAILKPYQFSTKKTNDKIRIVSFVKNYTYKIGISSINMFKNKIIVFI